MCVCVCMCVCVGPDMAMVDWVFKINYLCSNWTLSTMRDNVTMTPLQNTGRGQYVSGDSLQINGSGLSVWCSLI